MVVTGVGLQTPAGTGLDTVWATLLAGKSVAGPIQRFDPSALAVRFGCEIRDFDPVPYLGPKESRRVDRAAQLGFAAAADALADAGDPGVDPARGGVIAGTGIGGLITLEEQVKIYLEKGPDRVSPFFVPMMMANATAGIIGIHLGWTGPNLCISDRVRGRRQRDRRGDPPHPRRLGRRGHGRRHRVRDHSPGGRRVRPHGRAEQAQRRARARLPPVRRRPRRVRDG